MGVLPGPQLVKSALLLLFNIPCYRPIPTCHTWSFLVYFYSICFLFMAFSILELWCLDFMILVLFSIYFYAMCILELCCLDSLIIDYLRTVFGIQRI